MAELDDDDGQMSSRKGGEGGSETTEFSRLLFAAGLKPYFLAPMFSDIPFLYTGACFRH